MWGLQWVRFIAAVALVCRHPLLFAQPDTLDQTLQQVLHPLGLTGNPAEELELPDIRSSKRAQLGRELFFSKSLSVGFDVACASCHHPLLAGTDKLSLPVGVGAVDPDLIGPGRRHNGDFNTDPEADNGPNVERNSPTTFNVALYQHALFDDGRVEGIVFHDGYYATTHELSQKRLLPLTKKSTIKTPESIFRGPDALAGDSLLEAQARFPVIAAAEMRGFSSGLKGNNAVRAFLAKRLRGQTDELKKNHWQSLFQQAFNDDPEQSVEKMITFDRIANALAEYQRSQLFIDNPWKAFLEGRGTLSETAKRGALLFFTGVDKGGAGCARCHGGDFFTNESYHNLAVPQFGRGNFVYGQDLGRYRTTRKDDDLFAFRVPSLLNVTETAPYGHTGAFTDLRGIIKHHLNPEKSIEGFDFSLQQLPQFNGLPVSYPETRKNTRAALEQLKAVNHERMPVLSEQQITSMIAFLETLTDPCIKSESCLRHWLPQGEAPDSHRLQAKIIHHFDNSSPIPSPRVTEQHQEQGVLPDLGRVPQLAKTCSISRGKAVNGDGFTPVTTSSGITINRQFDFSTIKTSLSGDGLVAMEHLLFSGGVAAGDINGDCFTDLVINQGNGAPANVLINNQKGAFNETSDNWGIDPNDDLTNPMLVDINGDGWLDLFHGNMTAGTPGLYLNTGRQKFLRVSAPGFKVGQVTMGAGFGDVDGDGDMDVFLAHWGRPSKAEEEHLWLNQGKGLFVPGARQFGLAGHFGERDYTFTPNFVDINNDSRADLLSVADFLTTQVFLNDNHQRFTNITNTAVITDQNGMGTAIADFDNDGDMDWFVSSIYYPDDLTLGNGNRLYQNEWAGLFGKMEWTDITDEAGVRDGGWGWGACAGDFNNDGWMDIFHTNGVPLDPLEVRKDLHYLFSLLKIDGFHHATAFASIDDFLSEYQRKVSPEQVDDLRALYYVGKSLNSMQSHIKRIDKRAKLFLNNQRGQFIESAEKFGIADPGQGRGISCFDYDRDGDIDVLIVNNQGAPALYRNDFGHHNNFLTVKLISDSRNVHGVGAKIIVESASGRQVQEVRIENNYLSQNPVERHFGLGKDSVVNKLTVLWPEGEKREIRSIKANQYLVVNQSTVKE